MTASVQELAPVLGVEAGCEVVGIPRATYYRAISPPARAPTSTSATPSPRALAPEERQQILDHLHSERFIDRSPAEAFHALLDEDIYLGSVRTFYRVLAAHDEVRERRNQRRHPEYKKPELVATGANQVWSWDITKLRGPAKFVYFYLYVILDIFSRYTVGWMLANRESGDLATQLINEASEKQCVEPGALTIHSDRGSPMTAQPTIGLLTRLGITPSYSRPHVSDDNPFSESHFKTVKYHPGFPGRFGSIEDAQAFCSPFFAWYNNEHRHSGIHHLAPADVHYGRAEGILEARHARRMAAYARHPERFISGPPKRLLLPPAVYINPPAREASDPATTTLNCPTEVSQKA